MLGDGLAADRMPGRRSGDFPMLAAMLALTGLGAATLFSASYGYATMLGKPAWYFILRHAVYLVPSIAAFIVCSRFSLEALRPRSGLVLLVSAAILLLPFVPFLGESRNGASRWIAVGGYTFQPSELFKLSLVLYLAYIFAKKSDRVSDIVNTGIPPLIVTALGCIAVYVQNDFSTTVVIAATAFVMFWIAEIPAGFFIALATVSVPLVALSVFTSDFRLRRVITFLAPAYDPYSQGYQVMASVRAIREGGFLGKGFGLGTLKLSSVPEVQSDFVFAAFAEEAGFLGVLLFMGLWGYLIWRAYKVAFAEEDRFRSYLGFGLATSIAVQILVNVCVVAGLVPATGMALPLFSAGGSSLLVTAAAFGILYNLSRSPSLRRVGGRLVGDVKSETRPRSVASRSAANGSIRPYPGSAHTRHAGENNG